MLEKGLEDFILLHWFVLQPGEEQTWPARKHGLVRVNLAMLLTQAAELTAG